MSKVKKLIKTPKLFFVDMVNKRISHKTKDNNKKKNNTIKSKTGEKPILEKNKKANKVVKPKLMLSEQIPKLFNVNFHVEIDDKLPVFLYLPWIQEHGNELINRINSNSQEKFKVIPFKIAKDYCSRENRRGINKFARENPDIYRKIIARSLIDIRNRIKGFIFTLDWNPAMRLIVDVCRDYGIPTILIPHESIFIDQDKYYYDITSYASVPKTDIILSWGGLQSRIFCERGYPRERIFEVGTPKFDSYKKYSPLLTRGMFCKNFGLDNEKEIVLFSAQPLDSQLDPITARASQERAIQDLFKYTKEHQIQLIVRMPPSKDDILGREFKAEIESSEHAVIDDANFYLVPPEEAIYHSDYITSINSTMLFEGVLMNKKVFSMKYVEFNQIWEKAGIPSVKNYSELESLMDIVFDLNWEHPQDGINWAAREFSIGKFDGLATQRIVNKLSEFIISQSTNEFKIMPPAKDRFLNKERVDIVAISSNNKTLTSTQLYLDRLLKTNILLSTHDKNISLTKLASVDIFCQWGITPNAIKDNQRRKAKQLGRPVFILEDGFIRSVKIGLSDTPALSVIIDDTTAYYDATRQSRLEMLLQNGPDLNHEQTIRAREAINKIVTNRVSKYNDSINIHLPVGRDGVDKILLIDQRYGDQSVPSALADDKSFESMLANAISNNPDADIIIKQHPDAIKGGKSSYFNNTLIEQYRQIYPNIYTVTIDINPYAMFEYVKEVYVVSSGVGFEALMAGKKVHCFGMPYYAGWGLTEDKLSLERRTRKRSLEDIFYFAYIECSRYYNPDEEQVVEVENIVDYIVKHRKS
ncbi:hypothetical protein Q0Q97_00555 [Escherichia marmotae]|uniref:capsular polysaccharide export protein, LipB/KpsS family n=1 Tax=Escherichia marmotae TaxID=1499973 RepID=UPI001E3BCC0E|nr:hypothetical protein [Escherichia marmotae]MED0634152.1 hypothetical protein [Escherichia marmotae]MED8894200.1 hypothetical protein [Escherichia marmotae]